MAHEDENEVKERLRLQLSEYEMLHSMFPKEEELLLKDAGVVADIQDFLAGIASRNRAAKLEFVINIATTERIQISVHVSLPEAYPDVLPEIQILSNELSRLGHDQLNIALKEFLDSMEPGNLCVFTIIDWVRENSPSLEVIPAGEEPRPSSSESTRLWIQSHHIYSKTKMKNIADWAKELDLTGFFLAGKPGFICVEGLHQNCQIWWQRIRSMNWQRISCKLEEFGDDLTTFRKFKHFEDATAVKDGQQSDMKAFFNYLERHDSSHVFKEFFGFDGK